MRSLSSLLSAVVAVSLLLLPAVSPAKSKKISMKDVDKALLSLPSEQLQSVNEARNQLESIRLERKQVEHELEIAKLDDKAAKSWVDASEKVIKALEESRKASQLAERTEETFQIDNQLSSSQASLEWRRARKDAASSGLSYQQARLNWVKAEESRLNDNLDVAKLEAYEEGVGENPSILIEIGKAKQRVGKQGLSVDKELQKVRKNEAEWNAAVERAESLQPGSAEETDDPEGSASGI